MRREPVLILTGPPGAGKTVTARLLASRRPQAVHIESDRFFHFIESGYVEPWRPESRDQNTVVMEIVATAAARYAEAGYFTVVDGIVSPRWFLEPVRDSLASAGHAVAYAILRPPLEVCAERAAARRSDRLGGAAVVEQLWREFAELGELERHVVDTARRSPGETADVVREQLHGAFLLS